MFFRTDTDSPVNAACSAYSAIDMMSKTRKSAGTHSPADTLTISPGTSSFALTVFHSPSLMQVLSIAYISSSASNALSAFESYQIATIPLMIKISRMTNGSTKAARPSSASSI